ncbi:hypothetical protein SUGI_0507500 [Cryptomeria japonica]|uniref:NADH dehydrogenase [ubiquinone] 1 alpha subcomplex subunit 1 n=1 Tax=Cryptomeria japonica TaxID=3369 RepID=UPI002408C8AC|nr:NADH dehydrogenase [ubiquinone] 1 alpha subcomplex subunit 1 [Cryptomeria japonica]XP_057851950.1 NADH dehydrogenase [ubiquinone] 1 alpha subcomplex subunit 1 [Cryptomeria japonica]GLJ26346.1 hypothetical protein SUGI_0507500 [Cryptomeria japonica]
MNFRWAEAMLPLGIIAGMLSLMGTSQYFIHKAAYGRPKHVRNDRFDVSMERRDKRLLEQAAALHSPMGN